MSRAGVLLSAAMAALGAVSGELAAQCDGPVVVQVPKEAASIADAVAMACPGHPLEIVLAEGTWPMAVNTGDPSIEITIRGVSKTGSIVTETKAGVPLNTITGSQVVLRHVTVADISPGPLHSWILFDDCIVRDVQGSGFRVPVPGLVVARDTVFETCNVQAWGVLYLEGSSVENCTFLDCRKPIIAWGGSGTTNSITGCSFVGTSDYAIRAVNHTSIAGCSFSSSNSVAIDAGQSTPRVFSVTGSTFVGHASSLAGGAIRDIAGDRSVANTWTITDCTFTNNSAPSGGAMYFGIDRNVTLTNCVFEGNSATAGDGGAFAHEFGGYANQLDASNCTFTGNQAAGRGGAVFTTGWSGSYTISDCTFLGNAGNEGGGFYNDRGTIAMDACVFVDNAATLRAGAVYLESGADGLIANCAFTSNHAARGGAIELYSYAFTDIDRCVFIENSALIRGGAIAMTLPTSPQVRYCEFVGNDSPVGASIARWNTPGTLIPEVLSCQFRSHGGSSSDAVISCSDGILVVAASTFCDNAIPATFGDVSFDASNCVVEFCTDADGDGEVDGCACPGDLNGNFTTDGADLSILLGYWGPVTNPNVSADLNDDGQVDGADLAVMLGGWGDCP